ncbi:hypothetical protein ACFQ36_23270, partial [Arthrobacter sp. GCM10027362]|uniref:hypothetical protein n=1 Tax=Arthrobacter sp. GCM10027362 TaxID=3273379 RepID=UPI00363A61BA
MPKQHVLASAGAGAAAYGIAVLGAAAVLVLAVAGSALAASGTGLTDLAEDYAGIDPAEGGVWAAVCLPFLLAGMGLMGTLGATANSSFLGASLTMGGSLWFMPLLVTALATGALWRSGLRAERKRPLGRAGQRWLLSAVSGLALAVVAVLCGLVFSVRASAGGADLSVYSVSAGLFFGALVLGTLGSLAGRSQAA